MQGAAEVRRVRQPARRRAAQGQLAGLGRLLTFWNKTSVTTKWWGTGVGRDASFGKEAKELVETSRRRSSIRSSAVAGLRAPAAMAVLVEAREAFARDRRRQNVVNYVDLLRVTAHDAARGGGRAPCAAAEVPLAVHRRVPGHRPDPGGDLPDAGGRRAEGRGGSRRSYRAENRGAVRCRSRRESCVHPALRPGALFVVGDPKQSIFRFRRADIDIYNRVAQRIDDTGGEVLSLTANFRSLPEVCELANTVFPPLFAVRRRPYSPRVRAARPGPSPESGRQAVLRRGEADGAGGRRQRGDVAGGQAHRGVRPGRGGEQAADVRRLPGAHAAQTQLGVYAEAFDALEIPVEVSGAGLFCKSPEVRALAPLLSALADPLDAVALVGVLRGPLFGLSDPELFQFRQAGGRFELNVPLPEAADAKAAAALDDAVRARAAGMRQLREMLRLTRAAAARGRPRCHPRRAPAGWRWRPPLPAARGPGTCCRPWTTCARWWSRAAGLRTPPTRSTKTRHRPSPRPCRSSRAGATSCAS